MDQTTELRQEVDFRVAQVNDVFEDALEAREAVVAQLSDDAILPIITGGALSGTGRKLRALYGATLQLRVVAELGGVGFPPRTDTDATVWIGGSGWGNSHLPRGRGFRSDEFRKRFLVRPLARALAGYRRRVAKPR